MDGKSTWISTWETMLELRFLDGWYGLWMKVKGPRNYMVTVLGSCVQWSYRSSIQNQQSPLLKAHMREERQRGRKNTHAHERMPSYWSPTHNHQSPLLKAHMRAV
jgi:hypothetical protein